MSLGLVETKNGKMQWELSSNVMSHLYARWLKTAANTMYTSITILSDNTWNLVNHTSIVNITMSHMCRPPLVLISTGQSKVKQTRSARMPGNSQQGKQWVKHGHVTFALLEQCSFCGWQCIVIHALGGWQWSALWWQWEAFTCGTWQCM